MKSTVFVVLCIVSLWCATSSAPDVEGDVWGTWTQENSPYAVLGQIRVPPGSTLVIEPGVLVSFKGHYKFVVDSLATLLAIGTEDDSIYFTAEDSIEGWHGIRFSDADTDCHISYCQLEYGRALREGEGRRGGAIYCYYSSPTITHNTIRRNSAYLSGGAIYCMESNSIISGNTFSGNIVNGGRGGAIHCYFSNPAIVDNVMVENRASSLGGAIYCYYSSPLIERNVISGNTASNGGGIACYQYCSPAIVCNVIYGNRAGNKGGGVYFYSCDLQMRNTILWDNDSPDGPQIYIDNCYLRVAYCDVQGGWPGWLCIDADPMFVDTYKEDFHLRWHSPCIDRGDQYLTDPDGTRLDIGAFYFDQSVDAIVELYPHETPIVIEHQGGEVMFDGWLFNFSGHRSKADIWSYLFSPELGRYGPIQLYEGVRIPVDSLGIDEMVHWVPQCAPEGDYVFVAYIGQYPSTIVDSSYFYFTKEGEIVGVTGDWTEDNLPLDYALFQNYPNPFNATTRINYQLPVNARVKLEVYNLLGQKVATLVDSKQQRGYKSVVWDASEVSSGLYFYKLTAGDFTETKRMMLVK